MAKAPNDQQAALEKAFVSGTLPEEDRRAPEAEPTEAQIREGILNPVGGEPVPPIVFPIE